MKILLPFLVFICALFLQGCVASAVISTAVVSTKAAIDPRSIGTQIDDSTLEFRVSKALSEKEKIKKETRINVIVYQGRVFLVGQAKSNHLASQAKQIAKRVNGVVEVFNEIRQGEPVSLITASFDTWLTTKVRSKLLSNKKVQSSNFKVKTENGEVFLVGLVTKNEGKVVADIVRHISGVKRVTTAFFYIK